jgi:hypothetical protein
MAAAGYFIVVSGSLNAIKSGGEAIQAQHYAEIEANKLSLLDYGELDSKIEQNKWKESEIDDGWEYKINIGPEKTIGSSLNSKQRIAKVTIRKKNDTVDRFEIKVPIFEKGIGLPIGSIIPYIGDISKLPKGWFVCDGTNGTPDLKNKFLEGFGNFSVKTFVNAGVPNITGEIKNDIGFGYLLSNAGEKGTAKGSFRLIQAKRNIDREHAVVTGNSYDFDFDASRSSPVYGRSTTVQPEAYIVYYIVRLY